jgi:hypothetical protein
VGGPGLAFETWVSPEKSVLPEHPGLKSETWATHLLFVRVIFISLGGPKAHDSSVKKHFQEKVSTQRSLHCASLRSR